MNALYIFITTDRPDQYLNPIVHCIEKGARRIVLVHVKDGDVQVKDGESKAAANQLKANVYDLLKKLSEGIYKYYIGDDRGKKIDLAKEFSLREEDLAKMKARYEYCLADDIDWRIDRIEESGLRKYIAQISRKKNVSLDVTAVSKAYVGDIFACSLLENISGLYTFEVKPNHDQPWKVLIHALKEGDAYHPLSEGVYRYTNLVERPVFRESRKSILIRTTPLLFSIAGTILFITATLTGSLFFGPESTFVQAIGSIGTALSISSAILIYFPIQRK